MSTKGRRRGGRGGGAAEPERGTGEALGRGPGPRAGACEGPSRPYARTFVAAALALALAAIWWLSQPPPPFRLGEAALEEARRECERLEPDQPSMCMEVVAAEANDPSICAASAATPWEENLCLHGVAFKRADHRICAELQAQGERDACYQLIATVKLQAISRCSSPDGPRPKGNGWCRYYERLGLGGGGLCGLALDGDVRASCLAYVRLDPRLCGDVADPKQRAACLGRVATLVPKAEACEGARAAGGPSATAGALSEDGLLSCVAVARRRAELCDRVSDRRLASECLSAVAGALADASLCEGVGPDQREQCLLDVALARGSLELCERSGSEVGRDWCVWAVGMVTGNASACGLMRSEHRRNVCWQDLAAELGDASMCAGVTTPVGRDWCLEGVARTAGRPELCQEVREPAIRRACERDSAAPGAQQI